MRLNRDLEMIKTRKSETDADVTQTVADILRNVKARGDNALREYAAAFDRYTGKSWLVSEEETAAAAQAMGADYIRIIQRAAERIRAFHAPQMTASYSLYGDDGVMMGQVVRPIGRVGLYVPNGTAALPSTLVMNAVPAMLAGVKDLVIFTPVKEDGRVNDAILAAAHTLGIRTVYKVGGAHGIAAAAYGTETIPKVDKIAGPGNIFVTTAKRLLYGEVGIDKIAGPSEILIIADETADPRYIAADLLSQAEHDALASAILLTDSEKIILETEIELERQLSALTRADIARGSLRDYGGVVKVRDIDEAFAIANDLAPEHLEILTADPLTHLPKATSAGSIFLGAHTPEALGDYMSGPNHVLPTGGTAKFSSPLGVQDFVTHSAYSYYPKTALAGLKDDCITFAALEGLDAHANAVRIRFEEA